MFTGRRPAVKLPVWPLSALGIYLVLSVAFFGRDVVRAPATKVLGDDGADKTIFLWSLAWVPHALGRLEDPFATHLIWAPRGTDLAWVTWTPLAGLIASPVTLLAGPVVSFNIFALAAPALAAWVAFLLFREVGGQPYPALLGGAIFGFSPFVVNHLIGHLHMMLVFLIPLCGLLVMRRVRHRLRRRTYIAGIALCFGSQLLLSTELAVGLVLAGSITAIVALIQMPALRPQLQRLLVESTIALALGCALASPMLVHAFLIAGEKARPQRSSLRASTDVANLVVPTRRILLRPSSADSINHRFSAGRVERTAYLGLPLILAVIGYGVSRRGRSRPGSVLTISLAAVLICSFGARIRVAGYDIAPGPWRYAPHLPLLEGVKPARLSIFVALFATLAATLWLADAPRSRFRWAVLALSAVALLPNPAGRWWAADVPQSTFFSQGFAKTWIHEGDAVIVLPYGPAGWSMYWQAEDGLRFRLVGGHIGRPTTPAEAKWDRYYRALRGIPVKVDVTPEEFRTFLRGHGVDAIVIAPETRWRARLLVESLGITPAHVGDATVYRLKPADLAPQSP